MHRPTTFTVKLTTHLRLNCITATATNNFQLTFIQHMHLLVINFGLPHRLLKPFIYPFVYLPTCTPLGLTHARNQTNMVSGVESTSLWGAYPASWVTHSLSVLPSMPMSHPWKKHQTPCKMWNQKWLYLRITFVTQLYHKTAWGMSSLKTSSCCRYCCCDIMMMWPCCFYGNTTLHLMNNAY